MINCYQVCHDALRHEVNKNTSILELLIYWGKSGTLEHAMLNATIYRANINLTRRWSRRWLKLARTSSDWTVHTDVVAILNVYIRWFARQHMNLEGRQDLHSSFGFWFWWGFFHLWIVRFLDDSNTCWKTPFNLKKCWAKITFRLAKNCGQPWVRKSLGL